MNGRGVYLTGDEREVLLSLVAAAALDAELGERLTKKLNNEYLSEDTQARAKRISQGMIRKSEQRRMVLSSWRPEGSNAYKKEQR